MLFNSWQFAVFFPVVTLLYFVAPQAWRWGVLLAASCWFYAAFVPAYLLILGATIVVDYAAGIAMETWPRRKRTILWFSLISNVGFLFFFKYFNFFNANATALAEAFGFHNPIRSLDVLLPIGLSFHTFQAMSYTLEVYRGAQKAERHFGIYALYVMFYPQLVAGPIERPQNMLHQFRERHVFEESRVVAGLRLMLWGLVKKIVIADSLAVPVNLYFGQPASHHGFVPLVAVMLFAFQIYCDFSGYCDIALGTAQIMGFRLMQNFDRPYLARSVGEFWRRWHISLSTWFRDYIYVPLGGNRANAVQWMRNVLIVFLLSGLWHGAKWTYVAWGGLHGVYLIVGRWTQPLRQRTAELLRVTQFPRLHQAWQILSTFTLVCLGWIFFRAESCSDALGICRSCWKGLRLMARQWRLDGWRHIDFGLSTLFSSPAQLGTCLGLIGALLLIESWPKGSSLPERLAHWPLVIRWAAYEAAVASILLLGEYGTHQFIYFQF